jgi:nucleotide-binding universal stress UspA family protein
MKILLGLDDQQYSEYVVKQIAVLAANTWADVTLLTFVDERPKGVLRFEDFTAHAPYPSNAFPPKAQMLRRYWKLFLDQCPPDAPYFEESVQFHLVEVKERTYEEIKVIRPRRKELRLRLREGPPSECIVTEANEGGYDLVVLGCAKGDGCVWEEHPDVPQRVVNECNCSVMVLNEERRIKNLLCCLDQATVSQESLELINQLATVHEAELLLMGLTKGKAIKYDVDQELWRVEKYYSSRGIKTMVQLMDVAEMEDYLRRDARPDLLALWMGRRSLIGRFFPKGWVGEVVSKSPCSVIVLR